MELFNGIVCVTYQDLTSEAGGEAVMSKEALKSLLRRNKSLYVRRAIGRNCYALIDYYALPSEYRKRFETLKGDPRKILEQELKMQRLGITIDQRARDYFGAYRYLKNGAETALPERLCKEYTLNATILSRLLYIYYDRVVSRKKGQGDLDGVWKTIQVDCEEYREVYAHTLPTALSRLKQKIITYAQEGYASLISGKMGNTSAAIITQEAGRYIIALKRSSTPVYNDTQIFEKFNEEAPARGWKQLKSRDHLHAYLERPEVKALWFDAVHGELQASQLYGRKHRTAMASMRDALWYGDGTRLNLYYREHEPGRGWVVKTMQVYEVIDAYSEVMLGYHISETENNEAQYNAVRMAVQTAGCRPYEFVHDNQGGHKKIGGWLDKIAHVRRPTAPYSGQSKTIESVFGRFQAQILHKDWRFTGQNITAKKRSSRPNLERIKANINQLYTLKELKEAYAAARKEWNESLHHATGLPRMEMYRASENPATHPVSVEEMVDMFWLTTAKPSAYTDSGITIQVARKVYHYEVMESPGCPDHTILRNNLGRKFYVKYDPSDMVSVRLYIKEANGDMRFVRVAEPYLTIHRAIQDQQAGERAFISSNLESNRRDRIERQIAARVIEREHGMSMEQQGLKRPAMAGMTRGKEAELEIDREVRRRTRKYSMDPESMDPGKLSKQISNMLYDQLPGNITLDMKKVAGKL